LLLIEEKTRWNTFKPNLIIEYSLEFAGRTTSTDCLHRNLIEPAMKKRADIKGEAASACRKLNNSYPIHRNACFFINWVYVQDAVTARKDNKKPLCPF